MALREGTTIDRGYVTVAVDEGVNYREIAETMTELGFRMNHSSARNHVIRIMRKFVCAIAQEYDVSVPEQRVDDIAKSPAFQQAMADLLQVVEADRREQRDASIPIGGDNDEAYSEERAEAGAPGPA